MKGRKVIITAVVILLVVAAIGTAIFFLSRGGSDKAVTVVPVNNVYTSYWGDSKTLDGYVTSGSLQDVYMTEGGFDKVNVKEGTPVRKGDVLVEYNNTQAELTLKSALAEINYIQSQIAAFKQQISEDYKKITVLQKALDNAATTNPGSGGTTSAPAPVLTALSTIDSITYAAINKDVAGVGTQEKPYRILCTKDAVVKPEFWESFTTIDYHFLLDIYSDINCTEWLARWTVNTSFVTTPTEDWKVCDGLVFEKGTTRITGFDAAKLPSYGALTLLMPEDLVEKLPVDDDSSELPKTKAEIEAEITRLWEDIDMCNKQLDTCKRDLRQAQITYERNKLSYAEHKLLATIDGTVVSVGDVTTPVGEVFLRIQGESRFAVTLFVNELMLREVTVGTTVQLMCYESGTMASATITKVDTNPVPNYYTGGNVNASTYQVTAEISDPDAQPRLGEWCQATLDGQPVDQPSDTIYLPMFLIREDDGGSYVMRADENERLQKQYVVTGKSLWGSYTEIKSGVTLEDRLAFPYGKTVREGAPVVEDVYFN